MYGIHINFHPSGNKYVMIHQESCTSFKQHKSRKNIYTFNKNAKSLRKAIEAASQYSLEWHAPIYICSKCFPLRKKVECIF